MEQGSEVLPSSLLLLWGFWIGIPFGTRGLPPATPHCSLLGGTEGRGQIYCLRVAQAWLQALVEAWRGLLGTGLNSGATRWKLERQMSPRSTVGGHSCNRWQVLTQGWHEERVGVSLV